MYFWNYLPFRQMRAKLLIIEGKESSGLSLKYFLLRSRVVFLLSSMNLCVLQATHNLGHCTSCILQRLAALQCNQGEIIHVYSSATQFPDWFTRSACSCFLLRSLLCGTVTATALPWRWSFLAQKHSGSPCGSPQTRILCQLFKCPSKISRLLLGHPPVSPRLSSALSSCLIHMLCIISEHELHGTSGRETGKRLKALAYERQVFFEEKYTGFFCGLWISKAHS